MFSLLPLGKKALGCTLEVWTSPKLGMPQVGPCREQRLIVFSEGPLYKYTILPPQNPTLMIEAPKSWFRS